MDAFIGFILTVFLVILVFDMINFHNTRMALFAVENETEHNAEIARAKRDAVLYQLLQIAREYAKLEERILSQVGSYPDVMAVLGSLPSKFPNISAGTHYLALMAEVSREQAAMQLKVEAHNAAVRQYNAFVGAFRGQIYPGDTSARTYLGTDWINKLTFEPKGLLA